MAWQLVLRPKLRLTSVPFPQAGKKCERNGFETNFCSLDYHTYSSRSREVTAGISCSSGAGRRKFDPRQLLLSYTLNLPSFHRWRFEMRLSLFYILCTLWWLFCQVNALLQTFQLQESAKSKGRFALYHCLVLGHTKCKGGQRIYCYPFPEKPFYGSHRVELVMIQPLGPDVRVSAMKPLLVRPVLSGMLGYYSFETSATTDNGSKSFECALVSTLETYDDPENGYNLHYIK